MKVAEYVAKFLRVHTPGTVFMLSGTGSIQLDEAIAREEGLRYVCARHEATAAVMAIASSRVSGKLGTVVVTTGPGAVNAIGGVVEAWVDSTPLLVISGQVARDQIATGSRTFGVQGFDVLGLVKPMTKYAHLVRDPRTIRFHLEKALFKASRHRAGPSWLDIPFDVQAAEIGDPALLPGFLPPDEILPMPDQTALHEVLRLLDQAERPIVVLGQGVRQSGAVDVFLRLIDMLDIPVVATRAALGIMRYDQPRYMGLGGVRGLPHNGLVMGRTDFVLSLGSSLSEGFVGEGREAFSPQAKIVMVDLDPTEIERAGSTISVPLVCDVKRFIECLLEPLVDRRFPQFAAWREECARLKAQYPLSALGHGGNPINSYHLIQRIEAHSNSSHIFVTDTGGAHYTTGQSLTFERGQRELTSVAFLNMGIALPLAIGASTGDPAARIICISGDGSLELNIQELRTIVQYRLPIKVFVINNGGYGSIRDSQDELCEGDYIDDAEVLNFRKVAAAFEIAYVCIAKAEEMDVVIPSMLEAPGPCLIEVVCDPQQRIALPVRETESKTLVPAE